MGSALSQLPLRRGADPAPGRSTLSPLLALLLAMLLDLAAGGCASPVAPIRAANRAANRAAAEGAGPGQGSSAWAGRPTSSMVALSDTEAVADEEWELIVSPYLWAADLDAELTVDGNEVDLSVPFSETLDHLSAGGQLTVTGRYDDWALIGDVTYLQLEGDGNLTFSPGPFAGIKVDVDFEGDLLISQAGALRRLSPDSGLELGAGLRYLELDTKVKLNANRLNDEASQLDGVVIARQTWPVSEHWRVTALGDAGAGESDFTWQGIVTATYLLDGWSLTFGYRYLDYDIGGSNDADLTFKGALAGASFVF